MQPDRPVIGGSVMPKSRNQKGKLLYLLRFFETYTDEEHHGSMEDILSYLRQNDIQAERKSVYSDIETLREFGYDIILQKRSGYFLASRAFETPELKLLVDAVQASRFITSKKSEELIRKLEGLTSRQEGVKLKRQLYVANRNKAVNENIYYSIDQIYSAISLNKKIRFQYFEWNVEKEMVLRHNGQWYEVSPWRVLWDDENYYMIAYDSGGDMIKHFRIDKMLRTEVGDQGREGREAFEHFDLAKYSRKTFGMFAGEERTVVLVCHNSLAGVMIDRFGTETSMRRKDEKTFYLRAEVAVSPQFFGWLAGFGTRVKIDRPKEIKKEYNSWLRSILEDMSEEEK